MGKKTRNKGVSHEVHRSRVGLPTKGDTRKGNQAKDQEGAGKADLIRGWFPLLVSKVEKDFSKDGKIEWHGKIYKMVDGRFIGYYLPMIPDEQKLSVQIATVKKKALEVDADAVAVIYYVVRMENQEDGLKNQEHVELIFEAEGFCRKHTWDVCRESGKLPWLENGRDDDHYEGGRLLD
jgi:hypothetical protein